LSKNSVEIKKRDELKVLDALEQHANDSISELGQRCSFSSQKIAKIIKNLEKKKLIWGYTTVADAEEKNSKYFILLLKRSTVPLDDAMKKEVTFEKLDDRLPHGIKIDDILITHGIQNGMVLYYNCSIVRLVLQYILVSDQYRLH